MSTSPVVNAALLLSGLLLVPAIASASEANFDRTLTVSGNVNLYVSTGRGMFIFRRDPTIRSTSLGM